METRAHHILIGLFTLVVSAAIVGAVLWLGKTGSDRSYREYEIVFNEAVSGLSQGAAVQFNGIGAGEVSQLRLDAADPRRVLARIRVRADTPVTSTTRARLMMAGVTGLSTIQLASGSTPGEPLPPGPNGEVPQIIAEPSPFADLLAGGQDMMTNVNELVIQAGEVLSEENVQSFTRILANIESLTASLTQQTAKVDRLMGSVDDISNAATRTLKDAATAMDRVRKMIETQGSAALSSASEAMAALERTLDTVEKMGSDNREHINRSTSGMTEVGPTLRELRATLGSLRVLTEQVSQDPGGVLLNRDRKEEFRP